MTVHRPADRVQPTVSTSTVGARGKGQVARRLIWPCLGRLLSPRSPVYTTLRVSIADLHDPELRRRYLKARERADVQSALRQLLELYPRARSR
jgi:hypothetical protein